MRLTGLIIFALVAGCGKKSPPANVAATAGSQADQPIVLEKSTVRPGPVQPKDVTSLIEQADRLVVLEEPRSRSAVLFKSSDRRDLDALKTALVVEFLEQGVHCMCAGSPAIVLYANGRQIGWITNHHAELVRYPGWRSDARLVDAEPFLKWFDERRIPGPRKEFEAARERRQQGEIDDRRWSAAMPPGVRPHWAALMQDYNPGVDLDLDPIRNALADELPEKGDRILALFAWYGSGAGPWSGYPAYEGITETILLDYSTEELRASIEGKELTAVQTEGVARLFGSWSFSQDRPSDRLLLSDELKARLLKHSLATGDEDKQSRAQAAFSQN